MSSPTDHLGGASSTLAQSQALGITPGASPAPDVVPKNPDALTWVDRTRHVVARIHWLADNGADDAQ